MAARIKGWARDILQADEDLAITVIELDCAADACCGGKETVLGLFWPGRPERIRIGAPMDDIHPVQLMFALWSAGLTPVDRAVGVQAPAGAAPQPLQSEDDP